MARDGGRGCGCDPKIDYECEGHSKAFDPQNTFMGDLAVRGPFADVTIVLEVLGPSGASVLRLKRFQAEDLIEEIKRRLDLRG